MIFPPETVSESATPKTILAVEDNADIRELTAEVLRREGVLVLEATSGEEGLAFIARADQPIDLMITDFLLPGMDGRCLAGKARVLRPDLRILVTSGSLEFRPEDEVGYSFLAKPFSLRSFRERVRSLLEHSPLE